LFVGTGVAYLKQPQGYKIKTIKNKNNYEKNISFLIVVGNRLRNNKPFKRRETNGEHRCIARLLYRQ
jgi:hypothetical protein